LIWGARTNGFVDHNIDRRHVGALYCPAVGTPIKLARGLALISSFIASP
jgi:hypothetical protein